MNQYKKEIANTLYLMAEIFSATVTPVLIEAWSLIMDAEKITTDELKNAAMEIMKSRKYTKLPTPAEVLDLMRPKQDVERIAEQQADFCLCELRRRGQAKPKFDDPITESLMTTRWPWAPWARTLETEQVPHWRRNFVASYMAEHGPARRMIANPERKLLTGRG